MTGCGGGSDAGKKPAVTQSEPPTVRYECSARDGGGPVLGTATRASDGTWSIRRDSRPGEPSSDEPAPTKVGKDLEANLRANGCRVITASDPTTGSVSACPPDGTQQQVAMPDLIGLEYAKGQALLQERLCAAGNSATVQARARRTCKVQPGTFVSQSPRARSVLGPTTPVRIYVEAAPSCKK
jgi:hypothetical protein